MKCNKKIERNKSTYSKWFTYIKCLRLNGKACFQHDMAYGDFKDLNGRTAADKVLGDKAFNVTKKPRYDGYQRASMLYKFFDKKTSSGTVKVK